MGIFKSIGLFAVDIVKDIVSDALQLKKHQLKDGQGRTIKDEQGRTKIDYTGVFNGVQERTQKFHEDTRKKYEEYKKDNS